METGRQPGVRSPNLRTHVPTQALRALEKRKLLALDILGPLPQSSLEVMYISVCVQVQQSICMLLCNPPLKLF